nr:hypothetical protein [Zoogloeaceae bacterium]
MMKVVASVDLARRVAEGDLSAEVVAWLSQGFHRHLTGGKLDEALGLDRASRLRERNQALHDAAAILAADTTWGTAGLLSKAILRYEARILPLVKLAPGYPLTPVDDAIRRAFDTGQRVPTTARNLFEIIR